MKLGLGVKIGTSLALTPQLQQAIRLLQLSNLELEQEVQQQIDQNPLLERASDDFSDDAKEGSLAKNDLAKDDKSAESKPNDAEKIQTEKIGEELVVDTSWEDIYIHESTKWDAPASLDTPFQGKTTDSLSSHLRWQMNLAHLSLVDQLICDRLIDSLDERGFLAVDLQELYDNLSLEMTYAGLDYELDFKEVTTVLKRLQQCEPIGVAARDLAESLCLQLNALAKGTLHIDEALVLLKYHDLLLKNDIKKLLKQTKLSMEALQDALALIRTLDPCPASQFEPQESSYQIPDVIVSQTEKGLMVALNQDTLPRLRVNKTYANMIKRADASKTNQYLKTNLQEAKQFIKGVDERNNSLLKVSSAIVEQQSAFFQQGATAIKPMVLKEIAEMVDLHESTVSRITTNKYMLTPLGLYELKYFFSSHVNTDTGGECSSTAITAMIKDIITQENPKKPLSDNAITTLLQDKGIAVARRTVAKYRESLGFPSSSQRKRLL